LRIKDKFILYNTNDIKNIIKAKFKEFLWWNKELEDNIKLRYKKEVVNPNLEDQKYLYVLTSLRKRIDIATIRTNYHELHSESQCWTILKTPWHERIYHLYDTQRVEYENHSILKCFLIIPKLDFNFKIFVTISTFLIF